VSGLDPSFCPGGTEW